MVKVVRVVISGQKWSQSGPKWSQWSEWLNVVRAVRMSGQITEWSKVVRVVIVVKRG